MHGDVHGVVAMSLRRDTEHRAAQQRGRHIIGMPLESRCNIEDAGSIQLAAKQMICSECACDHRRR